MTQGPYPEKIEAFFNGLSADSMALIDDFYHESIEFTDPLVELKGRQALHDYYSNLYKNVRSIRFEFPSHVVDADTVFSPWDMHLAVKGLNGGREFSVAGGSHFRFSEGQAIYHRDYFDMGAFIYERVPVLKQIIGFVKGKLH